MSEARAPARLQEMDSPRYVVEPAPDDEVFARTDETVWFNEVGTAPLADRDPGP